MRPTWIVMLLVLPLLAVGCATNPATGERMVRIISTEQEIAIGEEAAPQFEAEFGGLVNDPTLQAYLNDVGQRVAAQSERQEIEYRYGLLNSDVPNAFALPGGRVYITRGLFEQLQNESQLAAVLGHETGHEAALHSVQALQRQLGYEVLVAIAAAAVGAQAGTAVETAGKVVTGMKELSYSRQAEYEADTLGIRYSGKSGYNPWGMVGLLNVLYEMSQSGGGEGGRVAEMFQTHPLTSKRIEEAGDTVRKQYPQAAREQLEPAAERLATMQRRLK